MTIIQKIDQQRFAQSHNLYKGSGMPFKSLNNQEIYLLKKGGSFDFGSIINLVKDNKDLITSGVSAIGSVASAVKGISDTVKAAKELEKIKEIRKTKKKDFQITPQQEQALKELGAKEGFGFSKF